MKYTVINLAGILNSNLSESLRSQVDKISIEPSCLLIDFSKVTKLEDSAFASFKYVLQKMNSLGANRIAFSSINPEFQIKLARLVDFEINSFPDKYSAKSFLEEFHSKTKKFEALSSLENKYQKVSEFIKKGDIFYINCPNCSIKLRIRSSGNHACPSCKSRFFFQPTLSQGDSKPTEEPVSSVAFGTEYKMLNLD
ncbi:MAG: hypothetical protein SFU98_10400 [Leptospiraceae bacterium]|nr:hypothetical protein [Leptospiraceae bacterium]